MARVDLTVRGGGILGLAVAWEAARRGARVRLIELARIGAGASGGLVGALAPHAPEQWTPAKEFQLRALLAGAAFWAGVEAAGGLSAGYAGAGRWQPIAGATGLALAEARAGATRELWQGRAVWRVIPRPEHPLAPATEWVIEDSLSARLDPVSALAALGAAIKARGGEVVLGEGDEEGPVVWATGVAGLVALAAGRGVKGQAARLSCPGFEAAPQLFAEGLHIVPHADGTIAVGSTSENAWAGEGIDGQLEALIARARAMVPVLADAPVVARWAGVRPRANSRQPLMGAWPGRKGHFVANGGFKTGFGIAPEVARVMVDLALEGRDGVPEGMRV